MNNATLINQTSNRVEYYTPASIIDAARATMGGIDLDPASSATANERIQAGDYYTSEDDGLTQPWWGRVWMNHPFGRTSNPLWVNRLVTLYRDGFVEQACCITFACTSEAWLAPLFAYPMCFLRPRTNYHLPDGGVLRGVTKGSVVTYLGPYRHTFAKNFARLGAVVLPAVHL